MSTYEPLTVTQTPLTINDPIPQRTLIALEVFRNLRDDVYVGSHWITLGNDQRGNTVVYRIVGWDAEQRGLIAELELPTDASAGGTKTSNEEDHDA